MGTVILSFVSYDMFTGAVANSFNWVVGKFGWLFALTSFAFVIICIVLALSPVGKVRFGGQDAKPEFSLFNWFAMSLCGGIAIGLVFWAAAEPIYHLASPPASLGIEPFSPDAAVFSLSTVFMHWAFTPYAMYVVCAIPIALAHYNYKQPFAVSSSLYFLIGDKYKGSIGNVVDALCVFAIASGVATSLGAGVMQIGQGLNFIGGIEPTKLIWAVIAAVIVSSYTISSYTGIQRGIRILSSQNVYLFFGVLLFVFITGPTLFMLNLGVEATGAYLGNFTSKMLWVSAVEGDPWIGWWTIFFWAAWMSYAPLIGMFLARITYGRTIRQFIAMNLLVPGLFAIVWFTVFGSAAINMQLTGTYDIWGMITSRGLESATFAFFGQFPLGSILVPVFLITICISFITLADSMTTCVSAICVKGMNIIEDKEPPAYLKIVWGIVMGSLAWVMISFAGIDGVKMLNTVAGWPIMFLMAFMILSALKVLFWPELKWFKSQPRIYHSEQRVEENQ